MLKPILLFIMKKAFLFFLFVGASILLQAQSGNYDKRLLTKFTEAQLEELKIKNPDSYAYWNFLVANSYSVMDLPAGKSSDKELKGSVKILDMNQVNILELKLFPIANQYQYFRIEGTSKMLMILPEEQVKLKYNSISK